MVTVVRDELTGPALIDARLVHTKDGSRIGYIFLPTFEDATIPGQVSGALAKFGRLDALILDVRINPGGLESVRDATLGYFISGVVGRLVSRTSVSRVEIIGAPDALAESVPVAVLIGPHTYSAAELFAGILKDEGRAHLVGGTTSGTVESLQTIKFEDGSEVLLAEARFDPAVSHADWRKSGIVPDVGGAGEWNTFTFDNDPAVAAALKLFGHA
jgi:carboxyl-terminal processing protease